MAESPPVALVTGGAVRLGRAIAEALSGAGFTIACHYRDSADAADELVAAVAERGGRAAGFHADLAQVVRIRIMHFSAK